MIRTRLRAAGGGAGGPRRRGDPRKCTPIGARDRIEGALGASAGAPGIAHRAYGSQGAHLIGSAAPDVLFRSRRAGRKAPPAPDAKRRAAPHAPASPRTTPRGTEAGTRPCHGTE